MSDVFSKSKRSEIMSKVHNRNTKPEIKVRKYLFSKGFRYRLHDGRIPGTPDIYLPKYKTVIFINGCFWHGHRECKYSKLPSSNSVYWQNKIDNNIKRDLLNVSLCQNKGLNVIVIWTCQIRKKDISSFMNLIINKIISYLN